MPLIPLSDAQAHVMAALPRLDVVTLPLAEALGLVLAAPVVSAEDVPSFANTAVDGFAVRSPDVADPPVELRVIETIPAGSAPVATVASGEASRIMTGAPMPAGADAVVMVERTEPVGDGEDRVRVLEAVVAGAGVRGIGEDVRAGELAVEVGTVVGPGHVGVLAMLGCTEVAVVRRPRVGVISTGDELVADGSPLAPGQIRDSNRPMLLASCRAAGFEAVDLGLVPDDEAAIERALRSAAADCDAVLTSGGVSMGDFDFVKAVLDRIAEMRWMQLAIKPAKPFAFGMLDDVPVFGLPGNPVSSLVSFELLARPGLRAMAGHGEPFRRRLAAVAGEDMLRRSDGKVHFVRVRLESGDRAALVARPVSGQGSHQLTASAGADALAVLPDGDGVRAGDPVELVPLS
jgi:molybdenum cofactor synthesis domain-containing protein